MQEDIWRHEDIGCRRTFGGMRTLGAGGHLKAGEMPRGFGGRWDSRWLGHCTTNHPGEQSPFPISHLSHLPISHFSNFPYSHFHIFPFAIFPQLCSRWSHIVFDTCQLLFLHPEIHPVDGILKMCLLPSEQISLHVKSFFAAQKKLNRWFQPKSLSGYNQKLSFQIQWTQSKRMAFDVSMKWNTEVLLSAYIPCSSWCLPTSADVFMCWVLLWLKAVTRLKVAFSPWKYQTTAHTLYSHKSIVKSNLISIISYPIQTPSN